MLHVVDVQFHHVPAEGLEFPQHRQQVEAGLDIGLRNLGADVCVDPHRPLDLELVELFPQLGELLGLVRQRRRLGHRLGLRLLDAGVLVAVF